MESIRFWKVETPFVTRYFESEAEADRFYNSCERATITTFVRRSAEKIAAIREQIAADNAAETRHNAEMQNFDARAAEWCAENN